MTGVRPQFDCPLAWCAGDVAEHGGDGALPENWFHSSLPIPLSGPLWATRWATGGEESRWSVNVGSYGAIDDDVRCLETVAALLEESARNIRALATAAPARERK